MTKLATVEKQVQQEVAQCFHLYAEEMANALVDPLLTSKAKKAKIEHEMLDRFDGWNKSCKEGLAVCLAELEYVAAHDHQIRYDEVIQDLKHCFLKIGTLASIKKCSPKLNAGKTWKEILAVKEATLEGLYKGAKALFEHKAYVKAEAAFSFCVLLDAKEYAFWIGLGLSSFHCNHYETAINAFVLASSLAPKEAQPHIYAANCFEALRDERRERLALEGAVKALQAYHPEAKELLKDLKKRLNK